MVKVKSRKRAFIVIAAFLLCTIMVVSVAADSFTDPKTQITLTVDGLPPYVSMKVISGGGGNEVDTENYERFMSTFDDFSFNDGAKRKVLVLYSIVLIQRNPDGSDMLDCPEECGGYDEECPENLRHEFMEPVLYDPKSDGTVLTITINGDELKNQNGIIVLHEKKNGSFEEVELVYYNASAREAQFKADTFSLYGVAAIDSKNPYTAVVIGGISALILGGGAAVLTARSSKRKKSERERFY